jgi:hypothetical protein
MAKHIVTGALYVYTPEWSDEPIYLYDTGDLSAPFAKVVDHSFEIEYPDDFDPTPGLIAGLQEEKRLLRVKLADELKRLDDRISKLSALTFEAA